MKKMAKKELELYAGILLTRSREHNEQVARTNSSSPSSWFAEQEEEERER